MATINTSYERMRLTTLQALESTMLIVIKQVEGTGQSHSLNGRSVSRASLPAAIQDLASIQAAIDNKEKGINPGPQSRFVNFNV